MYLEDILRSPCAEEGTTQRSKDFRAVALTSHVMKTLERLVLNHLRPLVRDCLDPQQFAYQTDIGMEDAIICLLPRAYTHLERPQSMVRIMVSFISPVLSNRAEGAGQWW